MKILFGELAIGKCPQHKPKLKWRDCLAKDLHSFQIPSDWHNLASSRMMWHTLLLDGSVSLDIAIDDKTKILQACCKGKPFFPCSVCTICNKSFSSDRYLQSHHTQKHGPNNRVRMYYIKCPQNGCSFSTHSEKGIKIHMARIHHKQCSNTATCSVSSPVVANGMQISCPVQSCSFTSTSTKGIKIHLRKSHSWSKHDVDTKLTTSTA